MDNNESVPHPVDILVVEDSETQANQIAYLLQSAGYQVRIARHGLDGLTQARACRPTLIVSDIAMPEMDGFELCRALKKDSGLADVPVILLTALNSLYDVIKALDCGADNFIRKPFEARYLLGRIRFILANRALRSNEKVQLGMQINLGGQTHFITAERQQIFDLLISTYEEAIQMTEELRAQQDRIARSYQSLEGLYRIAESLNPAVNRDEAARIALESALDLPGVAGGCILLRDSEGGALRAAAAIDFGAGSAGFDACSGCACRARLDAGELDSAVRITQCDALGGAGHISIPLSTNTRTFGVLNLVEGEGAGSSRQEDDLQLFDTIGNQIAVALERACLYSDMESQVKERTEALQAERNLLSGVVNTTGALVVLCDRHGRIVMFNRAAEQTLGWAASEVVNRPYWEVFLKPEHVGALRSYFESGDFSVMPAQAHGECTAKDGSIRYVIWSTAVLKNAECKIDYLLATGIDVTELRNAEEKVSYLSNFDVLTGLPNRILLRDRVRQIQERIVAGKNVVGFLLLHFPRLTLIRETLGGNAEQAMLQQIATRLRAWTDGEDSVARVGDSRFALVVVRQDPKEVGAAARKVLAQMDQAFLFEQQELHAEACAGITISPDDGHDYEELMQGAEAAMRRALVNQAERYQFYTPELNRGAQERFKLENDLRRALERDELRLHFQPQVDVKSGAVIGLEALVRWQHPELGLLAPGRFIGLAEETGLILPLGEWVLRKACEQSVAWQREGLPKLPVAVNLSAKQFAGNVAATVQAILAETGLEPQLLELELTESLSMENPESTIGILRTLKRMGVMLAIDDFGTGYSNLNYLKRFPVDKLKLDQSFVRDLHSDPDDLSISRAVIAMAHSLRLKVIAEGVETKGQLTLLAQNGCDEAQGYLLSRPIDAAACAQLLRERRDSLLPETVALRPYRRSLLFVGDEAILTAAIKRRMHYQGYDLNAAPSAAEAFEILATHEIGVVLCDQCLPGMSGTEFLSRVKQMYPVAVRMIQAGRAEPQPVTGTVDTVGSNDTTGTNDTAGHGVVHKLLGKPGDEVELFAALAIAFETFESRALGATMGTGTH